MQPEKDYTEEIPETDEFVTETDGLNSPPQVEQNQFDETYKSNYVNGYKNIGNVCAENFESLNDSEYNMDPTGSQQKDSLNVPKESVDELAQKIQQLQNRLHGGGQNAKESVCSSQSEDVLGQQTDQTALALGGLGIIHESVNQGRDTPLENVNGGSYTLCDDDNSQDSYNKHTMPLQSPHTRQGAESIIEQQE